MFVATVLSVGIVFADSVAANADEKPAHGVSVFGDLKYPAAFSHFDYVNPNAPKGGALRLRGIDSYDNLNPFILKGVPPVGVGLLFDSLMTRALDEPDALYGLIAKSIEVAEDKSWTIFNLRPEARFNDGTPLTAADVVFSFEALTTKGHPRYRLGFQGVEKAEALAAYRVKFTFKPGTNRDLPTQIATLPVISKSYYDTVDFESTTVTPPRGSGPYIVDNMEIGRHITYARNPNYWARGLAVNRGRFNFDQIRIDYYRDRSVAFEAFMSGEYDFHEEFVSNRWATQYNKPPVERGWIIRETLPDKRPSGVQAFFFNLRRAKFQDRRVRQALSLAFDFEWTNKSLFFDLYSRTNSMFENSRLAAHNPLTKAEKTLLESFQDKVPPEVFEKPFQAPRTSGNGNNRANLIEAVGLLRDAGWAVKKGVLVDPRGRPFTIEFLIGQSSFQRIIGPYAKNLKRLGIRSRIRIVDAANFQQRRQNFDFDIIMQRYVQPLTPGIEQRNFYGSESADVPGSRNFGGIKDPAVDGLIEKVINAQSRSDLTAAVRAMDRVLMWNFYSIPQWFKGTHNIAYWNKFGRPKIKADFDLGVVDTWWYDARKAAAIESPTPDTSKGNN